MRMSAYIPNIIVQIWLINNCKDLLSEYEQQTQDKANLKTFVDKGSYKYFRWTEFVVMLDQPISIVDDPIMRDIARIPPACSKTLNSTMDIVAK